MVISTKQIQKKIIINESVEKLWWRWTTHEGLLTFFGKDNKIELAPGGDFEIYFLMDNPAGLRGGEGCKVLSYLPNKMLSFSWNSPPELKELRDSGYNTWVVVFFEKIDNKKTEITLTHLGWPDKKEWDEDYNYFIKAWDVVFAWLEDAAKNNG